MLLEGITMGFQRSKVLWILGVMVFVPSLAHAHGFPWWFGYLVLSPFMLMAVLIAVPCKAGILRRAMSAEEHVMSVRVALILVLLDLLALFISLWIYGMVSSPIRDYLTYNVIDHIIGWTNRVKFEGAYYTFVAFILGFIMTALCAAILWFPHYRILGKRIFGQTEDPGKDSPLLRWSFVLACIAPGLFWFPACFRFM
jgi:hypothetical protein